MPLCQGGSGYGRIIYITFPANVHFLWEGGASIFNLFDKALQIPDTPPLYSQEGCQGKKATPHLNLGVIFKRIARIADLSRLFDF